MSDEENYKYGEVRTRKNFFPKDAREIVDRGTVRLVLSQSSLSDKTKKIFDHAEITCYENVEPEEVEEIRENIKEVLVEKRKMEKEKREMEKGE